MKLGITNYGFAAYSRKAITVLQQSDRQNAPVTSVQSVIVTEASVQPYQNKQPRPLNVRFLVQGKQLSIPRRTVPDVTADVI
jgi:hypothetical protein